MHCNTLCRHVRVLPGALACRRTLQFNELQWGTDEKRGTSRFESRVCAARAVDCSALACMQVDELAHSVLEQLLCRPSCAVPSLSHPAVPPQPPTLREFARDSLSAIRCEVLAAGNVPAHAAHAMADQIAAALQRAADACAPEAGATSNDAPNGAGPIPQRAGDDAHAERGGGVGGRNGRRRAAGVHGPGGARRAVGCGKGTRLLAQRGVKLPEGHDTLFRCEVPMQHQAQSACITYFQVRRLRQPWLSPHP